MRQLLLLGSGISLLWGGYSIPVLAQLRPDQTLGPESSQIQDQGAGRFAQRLVINGGSSRGSILFHSFDKFNVANHQEVFFQNPSGIETIINRVTGPSSSTIDGTLGILGSADLFLLNPNGILFGPNAALDIAGSFTASTADYIRVDDFDFRAVNPTAVPLLTLNVTPGIQLGTNGPARLIQNQAKLTLEQGQLAKGYTTQSLTLDAGRVEQAGQIRVPAGTVHLRGNTLQLTGTVDTRAGGGQVGQLHVRSPSNLTIRPRGPLTNHAINNALQTNEVLVESDRVLTLRGPLTSASINPLTLRAGRALRVLADGVESGREISNLRGNVLLQSTGSILLENPIHLTRAQAPQLTVQAGGRVRIQGNELIEAPAMVESDRVRMLQLMGDGGTLSISADTLKLKNTALRTIAEDGQIGPTINLHLTRNLRLQNSQVDTRIGEGEQSGNINIRTGRSLNAIDSTINTGFFRDEPNGVTPDVFGGIPDILSDDISATSQTGSINIDAGNTVLLQSSEVRTTSFTGDAGNVTLTARRLILDGSAQRRSNLATDANIGSTGNAGSIDIQTTESVELRGNQPGPFVIPTTESSTVEVFSDFAFNNTGISASSLGAGLSSPITIRTRRLSLRNGTFLGNAAGLFPFQMGGQANNVTLMAEAIYLQGFGGIASLAAGTADGGNIVIRSDRLTLDDGAVLSASSVFGTGNGGSVRIKTDQLTVSGGSTIAANTESGGRGGRLTIQARSILIDGTTPVDGSVPSTLRTNASRDANGRGRTLQLQTNRLDVLNGAEIRAGTQGPSDAGDISITANEITIDGVGPMGQPSRIQVESSSFTDEDSTPDDSIQEKADISLGAAGNITINAGRLRVSDRAQITTESQAGDGGTLHINAQDYLLLQSQGSISTTSGTATGGGGDGGDITLNAGFIIGRQADNSDITANAFEGNGGNINIRTNALLLGIAPRNSQTDNSDITALSDMSTTGVNGAINIQGLSDEPAPVPLELATTLPDPGDTLTAGCLLDEAANFIVTGRGGIPANPREVLNQGLTWADPRAPLSRPSLPQMPHQDTTGPDAATRSEAAILEDAAQVHDSPSSNAHPIKQTDPPGAIAEAQTWRINNQGQVALLRAIPLEAAPQSAPPLSSNASNCAGEDSQKAAPLLSSETLGMP